MYGHLHSHSWVFTTLAHPQIWAAHCLHPGTEHCINVQLNIMWNTLYIQIHIVRENSHSVFIMNFGKNNAGLFRREQKKIGNNQS